MTVYTWMVILLLFAAFLFRGNAKGSNAFIVTAFLILFIVMGLRDVATVGQDASGAIGSYPIIFENTGQTDWGDLTGSKGNGRYNIGFTYLMKLVYVSTDGNYQTFITIISLFVVFAYIHFIRKYSLSPIQSVLYFLGLLYYVLLFDALKQALAMAVLLFAFDAIMERKPVKFIVLVLIASQFHFPAMIFLPAYWIGRTKIDKNFLYVLVLVLVVTYLFRERMLDLMLRVYGGEGLAGDLTDVRFLRTKALVMVLIVAAAIILRPPTEKDPLYNACVCFLSVAIVFQTFCGYNNIFERLADYYFHTSIVLIPLVFEKREQEHHIINVQAETTIKQFAPTVVCAFAIWRFLSYMNSSPYYMNFRFMWQ